MSAERSSRSPASTPDRQPSAAWRVALVAVVAVAGVAILPASEAGAAEDVGLGTADSFAVLAGSGITNTGPTVINGDVGTFPTPTQTGFGSVTLTGTNHAGDAVTQQAKTDLTTAYNQAAGSGPPSSEPTELGGRTLTPGVYSSDTFGITGTLTLDTLGNPDAVFIFQAAETLITAANSSVIVLNGALACNVYWQIGSSATLGTDSALMGTVLAMTSITATTGATVQGRLLARGGAVTLDTNTISNVGCVTPVQATTTTSTQAGTPTTSGNGSPSTAPSTAPGNPAGTPGGPSGEPGDSSGSPNGPDGSASPGGPNAPGSPGGPDGPGGPSSPGGPGTPGGGTPGSPTPPTLAFTGTNPALVAIAGAALLGGLILVLGSATLTGRSSRRAGRLS